MVKNVVINCEELMQKKQAHQYLAKLLEFPDYYGKNLDALFDCLTELGECTITFAGMEDFCLDDSYALKVLEVFEEAASANFRIKLEKQEEK